MKLTRRPRMVIFLAPFIAMIPSSTRALLRPSLRLIHKLPNKIYSRLPCIDYSTIKVSRYHMTTTATTVIATDIGPPEPFTIEGNLTTRILPKSWLEYEHMKPRDRRLLDTVAWRQRIEYPQDETWTTCISSTQVAHEDEIALLDIDLQTPLMDPETLQVSNEFVSSKVGLQREANETVYRSLRRLEISLHKKLDSIYCSPPATTNAHRRRGSSSGSISTMQDLKSCILVSLDDGMSLEDGGDSICIGGTNKFQVENDHDNKSLWLDLMEMPSSYLWIDEPIANVTGVMLAIEPCPPTLLFVHTFEDFAAEVFVGVPLVLEIGVVHAKGALVVWFVNETQVAFNSMSYTPRDIDFGKSITVLISPIRNNMREGPEEVYQFANTVKERPVMPLLDRRSCWLAQHAGANNRLRVLSYNLMADIHLTPEVDRRANYAHCNASVLARTRRIPLLLYEILQHGADIVCLQEVDATVYESLLRPAMAVHGYDSFYTNKATLQLEGAAMFWSRSKFENEADLEDYAIRDLFQVPGSSDSDDWDSMQEIRDFLKGRPDLHQVVEGRIGQVLQIARLRLKFGSKHPIVVGNTHLFYHPLADHIRLMQTFVVCRTLDAWCQRNTDKGWRDQLLLCGDLNSDPRSGAVQLLVNRKVTPGNCDTWKFLNEYKWNDGEAEDAGVALKTGPADAPGEKATRRKAISPPTIEFPASFPKLLSAYDPLPSFTNHVPGFTETLDYIFVSEASESGGWQIDNAAPVPTIDEMNCPAIPNEHFPSDHISVACDLIWRSGD